MTRLDATLDHIRAELERIKTLRERAPKTLAKPAAKITAKATGKPAEPAQ